MPTETDKYLTNVNSQLSSSFRKRANANPFVNPDIPYGIWDGLGDLFGFNTNEDKLRAQYLQASREYDAQLLQNQEEQAYNTPAAQAQRMRQAGINPDLSGNVTPGEASEFDNQAVGSQPDFSGVGTSILDVASIALQGVQIAQGVANFASFALDLAAKHSENNILKSQEKTADFQSRLSQIQLNEKLSGFAKSFAHDVYMSLPDEVRRDDKKLEEHIKSYATLNGIDNAEDLDNFHKYAQLYARNIENERDVIETRSQIETNRTKALEQSVKFGSYFANPDDVYNVQQFYKANIKLMSDAFYQQMRDTYQSHKNNADYGLEADRLGIPEHTAQLESIQLDTETKRSTFENKRMDFILKCADFYLRYANKFADGGFIAQQAAQSCLREAANVISGGPTLIGRIFDSTRQGARDLIGAATDMVKVVE